VSEKIKGFSPSFGGMAAFDGTVKRINGIQGFGPVTFTTDSIAISDDGASVYGIDNQLSSFEFTRFSLAPTGISFLDRTDGLAGGFGSVRTRISGGRVYLTNGRVIDPVTKLLMGTYSMGDTASPLVSCIPDPASARAYCLSSLQLISTTVTLVSFDQTLFTKLAAVDTKLPVSLIGLGTLVRFGAKGFAVGASTGGFPGSPFDKIYLISSDIAL
jgi:hypothetical protein